MARPFTVTAEALIVAGISYVFFISGLANNLSASHDSINYLNHITRGEHLFHQHHLLYHFIANAWLHGLQQIFLSVSKHHIVEAFTAVWGSALLATCYLILRNRFMLARSLSIAGVALIMFSYGVWFYSINVEVYMPPAFFILLALYKMTRNNIGNSDVFLVAGLHSLAILFHQVNVLFIVVAVYWIYRGYKVQRLRMLVAYGASVFLLAGSIYFLVGWFAEGYDDPERFVKWVLGYTIGHDYWQPPGWPTIPKAIVGLARSFIGAQFIFQIPPLKELLQSSFTGHGLQDEIFLTRNLPGSIAWLLTAITLLIAISVTVMLVRFIAQYRLMTLHYRVIHPFMLTVLTYSLFFLFWMPEILEFWILQMVIIWLLLAGMMPVVRLPFRIHNAKGLFMLACLMFTVNYFGSINWLRSFDNDWYFREVKKLDAKKGDLVVIEDNWILKDYVRYYKGASVVATDEGEIAPAAIDSLIRKTIDSGGTVYKNSHDDPRGWQIIRSY